MAGEWQGKRGTCGCSATHPIVGVEDVGMDAEEPLQDFLDGGFEFARKSLPYRLDISREDLRVVQPLRDPGHKPLHVLRRRDLLRFLDALRP